MGRYIEAANKAILKVLKMKIESKNTWKMISRYIMGLPHNTKNYNWENFVCFGLWNGIPNPFRDGIVEL
jgi:hypothetical protein